MLARASCFLSFASLVLSLPAGAQLCSQPDNGNGTIDLPPAFAPECIYRLVEPTFLVDGLPAGATIELTVDTRLESYFNDNEVGGGALGGTSTTFDALLVLRMEGTGPLTGFSRQIAVTVANLVDHAPRTPGDPVQSFAGEWFDLSGIVFGDPDFDTLQLAAGSFHAAPPGLGATTLTRIGDPGSPFLVDSFFDVPYALNYTGAPGSLLEGVSGTTTGVLRLQAGSPTGAVPALGPVPLGLLVAALAVLGALRLARRR